MKEDERRRVLPLSLPKTYNSSINLSKCMISNMKYGWRYWTRTSDPCDVHAHSRAGELRRVVSGIRPPFRPESDEE